MQIIAPPRRFVNAKLKTGPMKYLMQTIAIVQILMYNNFS